MGYSLRSGFPHSDIYGSKLVCELPVAFRTLQRPSSPVIAKASTTCTYSLDPITLSPGFHQDLRHRVFAFITLLRLRRILPLTGDRIRSIQSQPMSGSPFIQGLLTPRTPKYPHIYFFQIFKDQQPVGKKPISKSLHFDIASSGLATHTTLVEDDGIEPTTSCLQSTRSPN